MEHKNQLQFIHDKVQEAALSAIPAARRRGIHWQIGSHLHGSLKLKQWERDNHVASAGSYYVHLALAHYYLGEYEKARNTWMASGDTSPD